MLTFLKYLPQILLRFKDVSDSYETETGAGRPWYLSRTFVFSALCFLGTLATVLFGISYDSAVLQELANNIVTVVTALIAVVGAIMSFVAQVKSKRGVK